MLLNHKPGKNLPIIKLILNNFSFVINEIKYEMFFHRTYVTKWSALIGFEDSSFSIINFLSSPEKQLKWEADGLPSDTSAVKNGVLIDQVIHL